MQGVQLVVPDLQAPLHLLALRLRFVRREKHRPRGDFVLLRRILLARAERRSLRIIGINFANQDLGF